MSIQIDRKKLLQNSLHVTRNSTMTSLCSLALLINTTSTCTTREFTYLRTLTTWHRPRSPAAAAAIDRYLLPAGPTAANLQQRGSASKWDRQENGRTPYRFIDPAGLTGRAVPVTMTHLYRYSKKQDRRTHARNLQCCSQDQL